MDYSHGRMSSEIEDQNSKGIIDSILRFLGRDSPDSGSNILDQQRLPMPYDPNNGIALGPSEDVVGMPSQLSQFTNQAPIVADDFISPQPPQSVIQGRENEALLNQMMPQTPAIEPYSPPNIPPIDQLSPQITPRLRGFQDIFNKIDPNQLEILKNIRGN